MKKLINLLLSCLMISMFLFPVSAEEKGIVDLLEENIQTENIEKKTNFKEECGVFELQSYTTSRIELQPQASSNMKAVKMRIVCIIIDGIIYDVIKYIVTSRANMEAFYDWLVENGYNEADYTVTITGVVYDNGCWQPEFPANPFCRMIVEDE